MLHILSPLQRALLQSAAALAPRGLRATDVQYVVDHYTLRAISLKICVLTPSRALHLGLNACLMALRRASYSSEAVSRKQGAVG
jgi:hypothetical protein